MIAVIRILVYITALVAVPVSTKQFNPCPGVFQYDENSNKPGQWHGIIRLSVDTVQNTMSLDILLDKTADVIGLGGIYVINNTMKFSIKNAKLPLYPGGPIVLGFQVEYDKQAAAPKLQQIKFNGAVICDADAPVTQKPKPTTTTTVKPSISASTLDEVFNRIGDKKEQCGKVTRESLNPLVLSGTVTYEGQWPWHIALYETSVVNLQYICGGTLLSHYHVITAAHCVTRRGKEHPRDIKNVNTLSVYLGRHNLANLAEGAVFSLVSKIIRHPDYNSTNLQRDLAIMRLRERVTYTPWVQPACLWPEDRISLSNIVGHAGSVVGWGRDENGYFNPELALVEMPVVSAETCLRSHASFFVSVTSEYTYCAGIQNGPSVCNGDSGGGMVFRLNGVWHLRGLVSLSKSIDRICDPAHYVVFTDLAKFLPWIKQNID